MDVQLELCFIRKHLALIRVKIAKLSSHNLLTFKIALKCLPEVNKFLISIILIHLTQVPSRSTDASKSLLLH